MGSCYSSILGKKREMNMIDTNSCSPNNKKKSKRQSSGRWKKKSASTAAAFNDQLMIPENERMVINGSSKIACLFTQQGKKGTNQDAMLLWENFSSRSDTIFCGVFDGHGPYGHMVAKKVRDSLPLILCTQWKTNSSSDQTENAHRSMNTEETASPSMDDEGNETLEVEDNEKLPEMYLPLKQSMLKAFKLMDKELKLHSPIDCFCSGTTAVTLIKQGKPRGDKRKKEEGKARTSTMNAMV